MVEVEAYLLIAHYIVKYEFNMPMVRRNITNVIIFYHAELLTIRRIAIDL